MFELMRFFNFIKYKQQNEGKKRMRIKVQKRIKVQNKIFNKCLQEGRNIFLYKYNSSIN